MFVYTLCGHDSVCLYMWCVCVSVYMSMYFTCVFVYSLKKSPLHVRKWRQILPVVTKIKCAESLKSGHLQVQTLPTGSSWHRARALHPGTQVATQVAEAHPGQRLPQGGIHKPGQMVHPTQVSHLEARVCEKGKLAEDDHRGRQVTTKWTIFPQRPLWEALAARRCGVGGSSPAPAHKRHLPCYSHRHLACSPIHTLRCCLLALMYGDVLWQTGVGMSQGLALSRPSHCCVMQGEEHALSEPIASSENRG